MRQKYVATIGCFDGVHLGHQTLVSRVRNEAQKRGLLSAVVTFDRLPRQLFDPTFRPSLLSTASEKQSQLASLGVDEVIVLPFTHEVARLTAMAFMQRLSEQMGVEVLVTGYDNRFGHNRSEGFEDYVRYGRLLGMDVLRGEVACFPGTDEAVSSSAIRQLLNEGDVTKAASGLSRYYGLTGRVVRGEHIGHELGFPTANLKPLHPDKLIPASGAYAVWANVKGSRMPAMMNIGSRPTFGGTMQTLEVNIFGEVGDVYGCELTVDFVARLREEQRFDSREALVRQLESDKIRALEVLEGK